MEDLLKNEELLLKFYGEISKKLTPEFSAEDWLKLCKNASQGDMTSMEMFMVLWETKVIPYLDPKFRARWEEN